MNLELDFRSGIPIYLQLVERIKEMIANGRLNPGGQLPTVRALATDLRINFNTVARAYRILDEAGFISTQQGRGTYILEEQTPREAKSLGEDALISLTDRYLADALRMGFSPEMILSALEQQVTSKLKEGE